MILDETANDLRDPPSAQLKGKRVAIAHDWLVTRRGGELVLDAMITSLLAAGARPGPIFTMFDERRAIAPAIDTLDRVPSRLSSFPSALRRWALPLYPVGVRELSAKLKQAHEREPFDLVVSSSSAAIKNLAPPEGVPHVCYCHSPARYLYDAREDYSAGRTLKDRARALGLRLASPRLRDWDTSGSINVTQFVANSNFIRDRIRTCYDAQSVVVHPPVRTDLFTPPDASATRDGSLLWVGALEPYKRVDLVLEAARMSGRTLVVIGDGSCRESLVENARQDKNITFLHNADDRTVIEHMRRARALVQPQREDFGITAVEAQACGLPVIALRDGGALDTVIDSKTGVLFDEQDPAAIERAIERLPDAQIAALNCRAHALTFSYEAFDERMMTVLAAAIG